MAQPEDGGDGIEKAAAGGGGRGVDARWIMRRTTSTREAVPRGRRADGIPARDRRIS